MSPAAGATAGAAAGSAPAGRVPFGARLAAAMDSAGPLCVGIDPHAALLEAWGLPDTAGGMREFCLAALEAVAGHVAAVKPQSAFFERHGSRGIAALEELLARAAELGVLTILDVKRGDIGSTMGGYAQAYLADGAPLAADAVTVSPYLGVGSLDPALDLARETGRGVFALALTSNPEGPGVQHAIGPDGRPVAATVVEALARRNGSDAADAGGDAASGLGSFGVVVGATVGDAPRTLGLDLAALGGPILAPGVGAQGAGAAELRDVFGPARRAVLATTSRAVLGAGPDAEALADAARGASAEARAALRG